MTPVPLARPAGALLLVLGAGCAFTKYEPAPPAMNERSSASLEANPDDVASLDAILAATYDVISGPAGEPRDWDRMRSLFHSEAARLMAVGEDAEGRIVLRVLSPDEYVEHAGAIFAERAFYERERSRRVDRFGHIAQVFSTYESYEDPDGEPFDRGINSFQLLWDGERWWVLSIYWDRERPDQPIPEAFL